MYDVDKLSKGDLIAYSGSWRSRLFCGLFLRETGKSIHFYYVSAWEGKFKEWRLKSSVSSDLEEYLEYCKKEYGFPGSYIHGKYYKDRVVPISRDILIPSRQKYYDTLIKVADNL